MSLAGLTVPFERQLLAIIADRLGLLWWAQTTDGAANRNRPPSILSLLMGGAEERADSGIKSFASATEFEAARTRIMEGRNAESDG